MIVPIILSGGSGTRLWPLSTAERPKQFLPLTGPDSLFRQTIARVADEARYGAPIIVANAAHEQLCAAEVGGPGNGLIVLEPVARNTAAAIAMAALVAERRSGPETLLLIMPSDHLIADPEAFHAAVETGVAAAAAGRLVTFGVCPTGPDTGYGYIKAAAASPEAPGAYAVARFTEKPSREVAEAMLAEGGYFWNGGIFLFQAGVFLSELERHAPDIARCARAAVNSAEDAEGVLRPAASCLADCRSVSVDYAVMERSDTVAMVPLDAGWSDVGSWDALAELASDSTDDPRINRVESNGCYVRSDGLKVDLLGVENLLVVAVGDRVVIMRKGESQHVRQLVAAAEARAS